MRMAATKQRILCQDDHGHVDCRQRPGNNGVLGSGLKLTWNFKMDHWKIMSLWRKWHSGIVILNIAGVLVSVVGNISMKRRLTQPVPHVKGPQGRTGNFLFYYIYNHTYIHNTLNQLWRLMPYNNTIHTQLYTMKCTCNTHQSWGPSSKYRRKASWLSLACFMSCSLLRRVSPVSIIIIAKMASSSTANRAW